MATNTTKVPRKQRRLRPTRGWRQQPRRSVSISPAYVQKQLGRGRITERDQVLMFLLHDCFVLSHDQIKRLYWPGVRSSSCRRRLRQLYDMHFLDRAMDVSPQMEKLGLAPGIVYTLGKAGRLWLEKLSGREKVPDYPLANTSRLLHDLGLSEIMVSLTEAMRGRGIALIWQGENEARVVAEVAEGKTGRVLLEPDAMMTLHYTRQGEEATATFFVEWDMGSERGQHFHKKVRGYDSVRRREELWQDRGLTRFPGVALVTTSERRAGNLVERIRETRQTGVIWLVTDIAALRREPMGEIWRVILKDGRVLESQPILPGV